MNTAHFCVQPDDYSRNQILADFMDDAGARWLRLLPCMKKSALKRVIWRCRGNLINDFFISDYDTFVMDRASVARGSFKARKLWLRDWLNFHVPRYILSDTRAHLDYWTELFGETAAETLVVPVLANRAIYHPGPRNADARAPVILFFGTYIPLQGVDLIVEALHKLPHWWGRARFRFIGRGQEFPRFKSRAEALGLAEHIEVVDRLIPETELAAEIQGSDIVLGVFGSSRKAESVVPNKVYQGLACKRCVVTADTPAVREFFTDRAMCLTPRSPEAIAQALQSLLDDRERRENFATAGHAEFDRLYDATRRSFVSFVQRIERQRALQHWSIP